MATLKRHPAVVFAIVIAIALAMVMVAGEWFAEKIEKNRADYRQQLIDSLLIGIEVDEVVAVGLGVSGGSERELSSGGLGDSGDSERKLSSAEFGDSGDSRRELSSADIRELSIVWHEERVVAIIIDAVARQGYGGDIEFLLSLRRDEAQALPILRVLHHQETPGIADFLTTEHVSEVYDGVSGATISSAALAKAATDIRSWANTCFEWTTSKVNC